MQQKACSTCRMTIPMMILGILLDGKDHYSAEFRDRLGLLEYRKPITRLRRQGYEIKSVGIWDDEKRCYRPGYRLTGKSEVLHEA